MQLASTPLSIDASSLLFQQNTALQPQTRNPQTLFSPQSENTVNFASLQPQNIFDKGFQHKAIHIIEEDADFTSCEPQKKVKSSECSTNLVDNSTQFSILTRGIHQENEASLNKSHISSPQVEKPGSDDQKLREPSEILSTNYSNSSQSEVVMDKEVIDLEEDSSGGDNVIILNDLPQEPFLVIDEVILNFQKAKEQVMKQVMMKNLANQLDASLQRPRLDSNQMAWLAAKNMQLNQMNQFNQRFYANQPAGYPWGNMNPAMAQIMLHNMKMANIYRQAKFQFQPNGFQTPSILGKREDYYENMEAFQREEAMRVRMLEMANARQANMVVVEDDEKLNLGPVGKLDNSNKKPWNERKKVFIIERTEPKKNLKKQIFKIVTQKPRRYIFKANYTKKITGLYKTMRKIKQERKPVKSTSSEEQESVQLSLDDSSSTPTDKGDIESEGTPEIKEFKEKEVRAPRESASLKRKDEEPYVIKLHIEDDDYDEIAETPIGDQYQVTVGPFRQSPKVKRNLKIRWNPSEIGEDFVKEYYKKIETHFERPIVNQEFALKTLKKYGRDVEKIVEDVETSKGLSRHFFEIRQKIMRSRVLQHHEV